VFPEHFIQTYTTGITTVDWHYLFISEPFQTRFRMGGNPVNAELRISDPAEDLGLYVRLSH
jgi:hypothetical protein